MRNRLIHDQGYPAEKVSVVPNGVDTALFRPAHPDEKKTLRQRWGVPEGAVVVLFAGRKQEVKGFDLFLALAQRLCRRLDHVFWLTVGPEPRSAYREPSHATCVQQRRNLLETGRYKEWDALPQFVAAELFRLADVLIAPSRIESQGMVMIEGLASGLITISTAIGGVKESICHGQTGFLLSEPGNAEELEALTTLVLERIDSLSSLRSAARAEAVRRYAWPVVTSRLEQIYQEILEN